MKTKIKETIKTIVIYWIVAAIIMFGWQGLELIFYGEVQHRIVDDIVGSILVVSIYLNIDLIKKLYVLRFGNREGGKDK